MSKPLPDDLDVARYMEHYMPRALNRHGERLDGIDCVLQFDIADDPASGARGGTWSLAVKDRAATVARGPAPSPRIRFEMGARDWLDLVQGRLNGPMAFMTGRIKVHGDFFYAMRLGTMLVTAMGEVKKE